MQKELPHFMVSKLIGSQIDIFHKDPRHQRRLLEALSNTHQATIKVGRCVFDLTANPLFDDNGERLGTMVEWADAKLRLQNLDFKEQIAAIGRSQAVIEFDLDGKIVTANDNFLMALGYRLDEIEGRHHSMFVALANSENASYRQFWEALNRGEFQTDVFNLIGKNGKNVWVQATYAPIANEKGKPIKVVAFAVDITRKMLVQKDMNRDLEEISGAMVIASQQVTSAESASNETASNVQAVATAAEELSASINEISRQVSESSKIASRAVEESKVTNQVISGLSTSANRISDVVKLINNVAAQTNLLALNATIEAARAGEAGKGFTVVAQEVKALASQTAKATGEISDQIASLQTATHDVVKAIISISGTIDSISEIALSITSAIEEQSAVTTDISSNMRTAATGVATIADGLKQLASATESTSQLTQKVEKASKELAA
ncbi:MAG: PAS domain S-box protein [Rhodomicrobium sp.]|nr:PAS domain S-box protein [Rhodomicrobium sp.]